MEQGSDRVIRSQGTPPSRAAGWEEPTTRALLWDMRHLTAFLSPFRSGVFNMSASNTSSVSLLTYNRTENQEQRMLSMGEGEGRREGRGEGGWRRLSKGMQGCACFQSFPNCPALPEFESWVWPVTLKRSFQLHWHYCVCALGSLPPASELLLKSGAVSGNPECVC